MKKIEFYISWCKMKRTYLSECTTIILMKQKYFLRLVTYLWLAVNIEMNLSFKTVKINYYLRLKKEALM